MMYAGMETSVSFAEVEWLFSRDEKDKGDCQYPWIGYAITAQERRKSEDIEVRF
jgi:hypothetical protein